ncbi:hypothetical protein J132_07347 [Termitomyces sp. J132]|nr:hypothetical protein J132_07347 [Termitomyces sp. J132]
MTAIIMSKGLKLKNEAKSAVLMVMLFLENNITNKFSEILMDAIMSKVLEHVEPIALCIAKSTDFISANSTSQAKTTLALKSTASQLESVSSSLSKIITKLDTLLPAQAPQPAINCPTWAEIASTKPTANIPTKYSSYASPQHTCLQQRLIHNAKTVLVTINTTCTQAPTKHTPAVNDELHNCTNKLLEKVNKSRANLAAINRIPPTTAKTHICGITWLQCGAYLLLQV